MAISKPYLGWRLQQKHLKKGTSQVLIRRSRGKSVSLVLGYISRPAAERCLRAMTWVAGMWHAREAVHRIAGVEADPSDDATLRVSMLSDDVVRVDIVDEAPTSRELRGPHRQHDDGMWRARAVNPLWLVEHARKGDDERASVLRFMLALGEWLDEGGWADDGEAKDVPPIPDAIMDGLPLPNIYTTMPLRVYVERVWAVRRIGPRGSGETHDQWKRRWEKTREGRLWKTYLLPSRLRSVPLGRLDKRGFDAFITSFRLKGGGKPGGNTVRLVRAEYKAMLVHAERKGHIDKVHGFYDLKGTTKRRRPEPVTLTQEEANEIIEHAATTMHAALFAYALDTGARPGEVVALRWEDVTWETSEGAEWGKVRIRGTKTQASSAVLPLGPRSRSRLAAWNVEQGHPEEGPVFTWRGKPIQSFKRALARSAERAGISKTVNRYLLRHTFATLLVERGLSRDDVARVMRHTNPRMVEQHYDHSDVSERLGAKLIHGE